ncbi:hypothetical protein IH979_00465 [Patescibacteria group bacterium]|nr:hypothetical protein [Patescibacteria group bacterium]
MPHPHQAYLDEFKFAIDKLVPLTPKEVANEAKKLHQELSANEDAIEKQIHQALTLIGLKEFPYRKAYLELCAGDEEQRLKEAVYERLDEKVKKRVEEIVKHGVLIDDFVKSRLFEEQFSSDERYQVEQAILLADEVLDKQCDERAHERQQQFEGLVTKWTQEAERLQGMIDRLRQMASEDQKWTGEINSIADKLEEGWSIVERDPTEEGIKKEIEYWNTVLHEEEEL